MIKTYAKGILSSQNGMNVYRGCSHGCIYCDARSDCYQMNHEFENIEVKINAPELLEAALLAKRKKCMIGTGSMCDPYLPLEKQLRITRRCLELIDKYDFGATVLTKSDLINRDLDLLEKINNKTKAVVQMTLTTYDDELCKIIEPNVCVTSKRFEVLMECKKRGIPTVVWLAPVLPFINDTKENLEGILNYCIEANVKGIICYGMGVTLRQGDREYFYKKLDQHFPGIKQKYIKTFGYNYENDSLNAQQLKSVFLETCRRYNILSTPEECIKYLREFPNLEEQLTLF